MQAMLATLPPLWTLAPFSPCHLLGHVRSSHGYISAVDASTSPYLDALLIRDSSLPSLAACSNCWTRNCTPSGGSKSCKCFLFSLSAIALEARTPAVLAHTVGVLLALLQPMADKRRDAITSPNMLTQSCGRARHTLGSSLRAADADAFAQECRQFFIHCTAVQIQASPLKCNTRRPCCPIHVIDGVECIALHGCVNVCVRACACSAQGCSCVPVLCDAHLQ
jgi:hypothetical protein